MDDVRRMALGADKANGDGGTQLLSGQVPQHAGQGPGVQG